jgi:hypothetical protein
MLTLRFVIFTGDMPVAWNLMTSTSYEIKIPAAGVRNFYQGEEKEKYANGNMYELTFSNKGGLVMPIIIEWDVQRWNKRNRRAFRHRSGG